MTGAHTEAVERARVRTQSEARCHLSTPCPLPGDVGEELDISTPREHR